MALYQKVPVSQPDTTTRYKPYHPGYKHSRRVESTSSAEHMQKSQAHEFSSDSSDDSLSSSLLETKQLQNHAQLHAHHRNYKHIELQTNDIHLALSPKSKSLQSASSSPQPPEPNTNRPRFAITRRTINTTTDNPTDNTILYETEPNISTNTNPIHLSIPPPPGDTAHNTPSMQTPHEAMIKYTLSSSDPSTLPSIHSTLAPPLPTQRSTTQTSDYDAYAGDKGVTWNYAYSYASSTVAAHSVYDIDDHKTIDPPRNKLTHRPVLTTELQPILEEMKISDRECHHHQQQPSLYSGFVTPNPIEVHNDLMRQPKLSGPLLCHRTSFDDTLLMKTHKELGYIPIFAFPIQSIVLNVDICLETAFIELNIVFINNSGQSIQNALFALPIMDGGVRSMSVCIQNNKLREKQVLDVNKRFIETFLTGSDIMDNNDNDTNDADDTIFTRALDEYIAGLFRFPISMIGCNDSVEVCAKWEQRLQYKEGRYHLNVPLQFAHNILPNNVHLADIIHINVILNSFLSGSCIKFGSNSHNITILDTLYGSKQTHLFAVPSEHDIQSKDFHIAYYVETNTITGCAFMQKDTDDDGHFVLYINPNTDNDNNYNKHQHDHVFGRDIIFLIDRSASMSTSYSKVIQGLSCGLDLLHDKDRFGIVCFNEIQIYFHGNAQPQTLEHDIHDMIPPKLPLFEANKTYISNAKQFVVHYGAEGGTDIVSPLSWSINVLKKQNRSRSIPYVVLITDGSDYQEKQIIKDIEYKYQHVRILTFGIGKYCNIYFLKLLAMKSRGWSDYVMYASDIKHRMEALIQKCQAPVLKDVCIEDEITNNEDIDLYPDNGILTDIYMDGAPIVVYGIYRNNELPQILMETNNTIRISGVAINGENKIYEFKVYNYDNQCFSIAIKEICLKQQIDVLTSTYWLNNAWNIKQKIVNLSIKHNISSEYTSMLCFECNEKQKKEIQISMNISNINTLSINCAITKLAITNKLFGDAAIKHTLCGVLNSIGQLINDDIHHHIDSCCYNTYCYCYCCNDIYKKLTYFFSSLCSCNCC